MRKLAVLALASLLSLPAMAHDYSAGALKIGHPWSRAMPATSPTAGVFMTINNTGKDADKLVSATSPQAGKIEMHTHVNDNGVMRMREVAGGITVPAGEATKLAPGGLHVMLFDIKQQAKVGDKFPLVLKFEKAGEVKVDVKVEAGAPAAHAH